MSANVRAHVLVSGRVQGVAFRYETQRAAERIGVRGWVRNLADGRVEAVFEGLPAAVEEMIAWCRRGPGLARVTAVEVQHAPATGEFERFTIAR
jgi:acylphosphatase